jgi:TolA-binding protein
MIFTRRFFLIALALALGGEAVFAAGSAKEERDFAAAANAFQAGMWSRAEVEFARFVEKFPKSDRAAEASLMQAEADFKQGKFLPAIALLEARESRAGDLEDQYVYWIGEAQFQNKNFSDAAETFSRLASSFTNSDRRLDAVVNEAAARAKLRQWVQVGALLQKPDGIFQQAAQTNAADERVVGGQLLLAQALLAQNRAGAAAAVLQSPVKNLKPELDWQRIYLLCRAELAGGETNAALALTTNLMETAVRAGRADLLAQSVSEQAGVMEKIGRLSEAMSIYAENLATNAPDKWQRQAVLKIAELAAAQKNISDADESLKKFLARFPDSPEAATALLALGELHLKNYVSKPAAATNDLQAAQSRFDQFIGAFTNSPLLGKAFLDRGWCFWLAAETEEKAGDSQIAAQTMAECLADFQSAVEKLPPSVDLAVARFKLGDAEFHQNDFAGARENYQAVAEDFTNFPVVGETLGAQAVYQTLRVCMDLKDFSGASNSLARILKIYPASNLADKSILLVGEGQSDLGHPVLARALFQKFEENYPDSEQLPEVEWDIARTYEQENDWPSAIGIYDAWVNRFTNDAALLPSIEYARAWANSQAGRETNAFLLFTNFVAQFPTNVLAPVAQWWVGDHFFRAGNFPEAEKNYKYVFQNWPASSLAYHAKMKAGRAAMAWQNYPEAIDYFMSLTSDTNCPPALDAQALFAYGSALMQMPSQETNNPLANFQQAIPVFKIIYQNYPGSEQAALAWGETGDCYFQLAAQTTHFYDDATNAYAQVIASPQAEVAERSQAQIGIGLVFEKRAALMTGTNQTALLQTALNNYLDVSFGSNLRDNETVDPFWVEEAVLRALPLIETLGAGNPNKFIDQMEESLPQLKSSLEKMRASPPPAKN